MAKDAKTDELKRGAKVVALADMRGVPRGTTGRVTMVSGLTWIRYFVDFDNGVGVPSVSRSMLATPAEWREWKDRPAGAGAGAEAAAEAPAAEASSGAAVESVGGIPAHLLERSRLARERWAAKAG